MSGRLSVILKRLTEHEIRKWTRSSSSASQQPENPAKKIKRVPRPKFLNRSLNSFPCPKCNLIFFKSTSLETHYQNVHRIWQCPVKSCNAFVDSSKALERHYEKMHSNVQTLTCDFCGEKTTCFNQMENHISTLHLAKKEMHCPRCPKMFSDRDTYLKHVETDHKQMFNCPHCGRTDAPFKGHLTRKVCLTCKQFFHCLTSAAQHQVGCRLKDSKGRRSFELFSLNHECRMCFQVILLNVDRRRHLLEKHAKELFPCPRPKCRRLFMTPEFLDQHFQLFHPPKVKHKTLNCYLDGSRCLLCGMEGNTLIKFKRHVNAEHPEEVFKCLRTNCKYYFDNRAAMLAHVQKAHEKEGELRLNCAHCGYSNNRKSKLLEHVTRHFPATIPCPRCPKKLFATRALLRIHSLKHQRKRCVFCRASHAINESLCLRCYDNFECSKNYRKHVLTCDLPYKCRVCGAEYCLKQSLMRHYQSSTHGVDGIKLLETLKAAPSFEHRQNLEKIHRVKSEMEEEEVVFD